MEIATLTRHRLTSQSIFQGPRSPYITEREQIQDRKAGLEVKTENSPLIRSMLTVLVALT
jgi:hypothetical protein